MFKKKGLILICLAFIVCVQCSALAMDTFSFEAKVNPSIERQVAPPFEGAVDEVFVQAGDRVKKGDVLFQMKANELVAKEPGTIEAVFATEGADGKSIEETYHASVVLRPEYPMYVIVGNKDAAAGRENIRYTRGETVYLKSKKNGHTGVGRVINIQKWTITVELRSGDLVEGDSTSCYRSETFQESKRLGTGVVQYFDLTMLNMEGYVLDVPVKLGDVVKPGDVVLKYAPSTELSAYAEEEAIVMSVNASGAVSLANISELVLTAKLNALELSLLQARSKVTIYQEGNKDFAQEGKISWISSIADENGLFEVRILCPQDIEPRIGTAYQIVAE